jgi:hypothetical protein
VTVREGRAPVAAFALMVALAAGACRTGGGVVDEAPPNVKSTCNGASTPLAACLEELDGLLANGAPAELAGRVARRVLARAEADRIVAQARGEGEPSGEEIEAAADGLWPRWNDGPVVDVVHALFAGGEDSEKRARAFASSLPAGVDEEQFKAAAKSAGAAAVERINGIGNRGRTLAGLVLVSDFSNAAIRLTTSSPRSDVIHTSYGSHIVLLLGRAEPEPFVPSERASGLREEAMNRRVRARIAEQRGKFAVEVRQEALQSLEIPAPSP